MFYDPTPVTPSNLVPANQTVFDQATTSVTLSWQDARVADTEVADTEVADTDVNTIVVPAPVTTYSVRVTDLTEPELRHADNNCQAKKQYVCRDVLPEKTLTIVVHPTHAYSWEVFKSVEYSYLVNRDIKKSRIRSEKATGTFRIGECNAAEIVSVAVPEIIAPGAIVTAKVVVRNAGSTTWTKESGYQLGSLSPNPMVWGISRVNLNPGSPVMPGQLKTFNFTVTAPQNPGKYFFQWRMILSDSVWFGVRTTNRYLKVGSPTTIGPAWATRDLGTGLLRGQAGGLITLRGGNYHIFEKDSAAQRKLVDSTGATIVKDYQDVLPCPGGLDGATLKVWDNKPLNTWAPLFTTLFNGGNNLANLLRVFLMNGFGINNPGTANENPEEVYPFILSANSPRKWLVEKAISAPNIATNWNVPYFTRLKAFAEHARLKGVFLQLSLFNYYEMDNDTWDFSIWNPTRSKSVNPGWGAKNLVNPQLPNPQPPPATFACSNARSTAEGVRHCFFIEPPLWSGLRKVQEQFVRKVVRELRGKPNIILEVMNEPRGGSHKSSALFASTVIDWIIDEGHKKGTTPWRPLISVNASLQGIEPTDPDQTDPDRSDVDWWGDPVTNPRDIDPNPAAHVKNYEEIDIISYHGLSGYGSPNLPFRCSPLFPTQYRPIFYVDPKSIRDRIAAFRLRHPSKALMLSTDSVRFAPYKHNYGDDKAMDLRDGQITTNLNHGGGSYYEQMTRSDLTDWAFWCFQAAREKGTIIHFQNHSNFEAPYATIDQAYKASLL